MVFPENAVARPGDSVSQQEQEGTKLESGTQLNGQVSLTKGIQTGHPSIPTETNDALKSNTETVTTESDEADNFGLYWREPFVDLNVSNFDHIVESHGPNVNEPHYLEKTNGGVKEGSHQEKPTLKTEPTKSHGPNVSEP